MSPARTKRLGHREPDLEPRKWPQQERSRATFDAILEGCARVLKSEGLASATTNRIAREAGVGIGSLYEFFPGRDAILAVLCHRRLDALGKRAEAALESVNHRSPDEAVRIILSEIVEGVFADRWLFRVLLREAPFLRELPEIQWRIARLLELGRLERERRKGRRLSQSEQASNWLLGRMLAAAVVDVVFAGQQDPPRDVLKGELINLVVRMRDSR